MLVFPIGVDQLLRLDHHRSLAVIVVAGVDADVGAGQGDLAHDRKHGEDRRPQKLNDVAADDPAAAGRRPFWSPGMRTNDFQIAPSLLAALGLAQYTATA